MAGAIDIRISPGTTRFNPSDERWVEQLHVFAQELREATGSAPFPHEPSLGSKGALGDIVLTLSSAGVVTATLDVVKSWLTRDRGRSVTVVWHEDGRLKTAEVTSAGVDNAEVDALLRSLRERLDGPC